ncbi:MAG: dicarboxylate transporter/tellurite-resistance protein TehA, partial [Tolumonas sp.]|nr:dicarboxylate transporter/tellurite-resistance protein TehA [Tolumonas sp.]
LGAQAFAPSYWAYTFGVAATTVSGLKLAAAGLPSAQWLSIPIFIGANLFIGYLAWRTLQLLFRGQLYGK